tara:strand:- start:1096 stop:3105 length:2010 start_codon:yes stop_codon:yes gene_type:complete
MKMAFMQEGGLQDEGGTVDKESGNDVPSGSLKKEVRDDIPAMLSEGEFVFPADVVRYIGLSKLMELRQEAKMGLKVMEEMGQMGNSEEATLPDNFGIPDIEIIEDDDEELDGMDDDDDENDMDNMTESGKMMVMEKRAQGGVIYAQQGTDVPQQTDFEQMMGYEAGQGSNPYARKGPFIYENDKGETAMVYHDYMNRPMDVPSGYKIREDQGEDTPAPSPDPTPDDGESVRDTSNRDARRAAKADARKLAVDDAMQTSAERVGMTLGEYEKLTLSQRIKLIPQEIKVMTGSDVSSEVVEDVINNPNKSTDNPAVSFIKTVIGGILKTVGIDINKTSDNIAGAIKENGNATKPLSRPMLNGKNVSIANDVPDELSDSPQFNNVSSTSTFDANKPDELIDSPQFNNVSTTKPIRNTRPDALDITTPRNRYDDVSAADPMPDAFEPYKPIPQGEGSVDMKGQLSQNKTDPFDMATKNTVTDTRANDAALATQTNNMLGAAQATTSPFGSDPTFASSVILPKVEPVSTPSFVQGMTDADRVAGTTPERKGQIFDSVPTMFDLSGYKERQAQRQADFDAQVDQINEGLKILEGTTLSSGDKKKTNTRKLKIDAKQGTGAFADKQRKDKDRDKRRKKQDAKKAADKRVKDYKEGKQTFRGRGGRAQGGLMKKDYP